MGDILMVCVLGIGTVFFGLICIVVLCKIMSSIIQSLEAGKASAPQAAPVSAPAAPAAVSGDAAQIQNRQEVIAAVSAAIAEMLGTDISAIRIVSFKKL